MSKEHMRPGETRAQAIARISLEIGDARNRLYKYVARQQKHEQKLRYALTSRESALHQLMYPRSKANKKVV